ncbi:MAG: ferrochelatase [Rhodospirillaceae bacterium]|nr:ferrochelatase [Rhodospirillaceae bacterium]
MSGDMKTAVVLFNLGGPDGLQAVRPFLFNLFNDPAIINLPTIARWLLAQLMSRRRAPVARDIYNKIGGSSPLLQMTEIQASALDVSLNSGEGVFKSFVCMRYWHPMSADVAARVRDFAPDRIVLLPLYPQFSTTTTASSLGDWHRSAAAAGLDVPTATVCCYPGDDDLARAVADLIRAEPLYGQDTVRVLFSAHGLPQKIVDAGDPYPAHVAKTVETTLAHLDKPDLDWAICYQSRVGPLQWIGPSLNDELKRAAADQMPVVVVPIAFVSEHSETLVELDMEYREMAAQLGVPEYARVPTVCDNPHFIGGLTKLVERAIAMESGPASGNGILSGSGERDCPTDCQSCPNS